MSTLISSAVGKKVAAPKQAARRRQPPAPSQAASKAAPAAPSEPSTAVTQPSAAPPSPPPTQPPPAPADNDSHPPSPPPQAEPPIETHTTPAPTAQTSARDSEPAQPGSDINQDDVEPQAAEGRDEPPTEDTRPAASNKRQRDAAPAEDVTQPAKRARKSSARSNATVQAAIEEEGTAPAQAATASKKRPGSSRAPDRSTSAAPVEPPSATSAIATKKPPTKRKAKAKAASTAADTPAVEEGTNNTEGQSATTAPGPKKKKTAPRRKKKQQTSEVNEAAAENGEDVLPEQDAADAEDEDLESDPELHEIDPNTVLMWEVGKNKKHGKTSEREKKMAQIDWAEVARKRREAADRALAGNPLPDNQAVVESTEGPDGVSESPAARTPQTPAATSNTGGVQFHIVNGQIVEDEATLTIDRQAQAEAEAATAGDQLIEEEVDLTTRVNRTTHLNDRRRDATDRIPVWRSKSDPWTEEETDRFYEALKMFGTDFFIISKMFAPKTRRQIKTKFVREERLDPPRINAALLGKESKPMDLEHYAREVGTDVSTYTKYEGIKQAEEMIKLGLADREEELRETIREEERLDEARKKEQQERDTARKKGTSKKGKGPAAGAGGRKKKEATMGGGGPVESETVAGAEA